jgi:hypothetical protein
MDTKDAIIYCDLNNIDGDYVECGVYTGIHPVLACNTIIQNNLSYRNIFMYDTFEGLTEPGDKDYTLNSEVYNMDNLEVRLTWENHKERHGGQNWCECSLEEVKKNVESTKYPKDKLFYIKGDV